MTASDISRRTLLRCASVGGVTGLAGCNTGGPDGDDGGNGQGTADTSGGETDRPRRDSATIALKENPTEDVWAFYGGVMPYFTNVVEPLIWVGDDLEAEPWLATDWERTGERTFVFDIRQDVTFHNGAALTAEEVVWSFEALFDNWAWTKGWLHLEPDGVQAVDDHTVEFTTTSVLPQFPGTVAHNMVAVQHPDRERDGGPIGTGPYRVEEIQDDDFVDVSAFEDYWGGAPATPELTYQVMTDPSTRSLAVQSHDVHVAFDPPRVQVSSLREEEATTVHVQEEPSTVWADIHNTRSPTDDERLRKALNYAVDQESIVDSILDGIGQPARGVIAPTIYWSAHDDLPVYGPDVERAEALVEESSYSGETLEFVVQTGQPVEGDVMAQVIQRNADDIGVDIEISMVEAAAFDDAIETGDGHLFLREGGTNSVAADYLLVDFFWSEGCCSYWRDLGEAVDERILEGNRAADAETKTEAYGEAQVRIMEQAAILPVHYLEYVTVTSSAVEGLDLRPIPNMNRWTDLVHYEAE
jgi:peptide/nickel transport system substrate-binding protein